MTLVSTVDDEAPEKSYKVTNAAYAKAHSACRSIKIRTRSDMLYGFLG
jgi:hypothetical protein